MTRQNLPRNLAFARHIAAIATAFFLPLSTSGQNIAVTIFALLALATIDGPRFHATLRMPAAYVPALLFALILAGVLWSPVPFALAIKGVGPYAKLLLIPLILAIAMTPKQALQIGCGFLAGCLILLALSWASVLWPGGPWGWFKSPGVPVKDNAVQSGCFALCAFGLAIGAVRLWSTSDRRLTIAMLVLAVLFFADIFLIYISKTGMLMAAAMLGLFLIRIDGWRRVLLIAVPAVLVIGVALYSSAPAQRRLSEISTDINASNAGTQETISTASRLDFWTKAVDFVKAAPLLGHGTGSIRALYQSLEATRPSPYGEAVADPHNQFLHVVLQVGLIGGLLLLAMWAAHIMMFPGNDYASIIGQAVVLQNFIGSLFNSHISTVTLGMLYCLGVGLLGAVARGASRRNVEDDRVKATPASASA